MVKQERAHETRRHIIDAAAARFDVIGFDRATLAEIAELCGVTKGALYFHFSSKDDLAAVVIAEQHAISMAAVELIRSTAAPALEHLAMMAHEMGRQIVEDTIVRAGIRLTLELGADAPVVPYRGWIEGLEDVFRAAIAEGDVPATVDTAVLARYFVSAFTGVQLVSDVFSRRGDLATRIDEMLTFVLMAIVAPGRHCAIDGFRRARWEPHRTQ